MGLREWWRLTTGATAVELATASALSAIPSPATSEALVSADVAGAFGITLDSETVTRRDAMRVPAVKRGRNVIAGTIGTLPLVCARGQDVIPRQLLDQPDPNTTRAYTLTWTVDDLIFHGLSWWRVLGFDSTGFPVSAERVAPERVGIDYQSRRIRIDGELVDDREVIRFDGLDEGVLALGADVILTARQLQAAARNFARLDVPLGSLEPAEGAEPLDNTPGSSPTEGDPNRSEVDELLDGWEAARARRTTAYLRNVTYRVHQLDARSLQLAELIDRSAGEIARELNLPARFVNAPSGDSLTYATSESERRDLVDLSFAPYLAAISQRLSMPDVTPRGQLVSFDLAAFLRGDLSVVAGAITAGVTDAAEARTWLGLRPRTDLPRPAAPPPPAGRGSSTEEGNPA